MSATETFSGKTTAAGNSKALRIDADFFRQHPEFDKGATVEVHTLGEGLVIITVIKSAKIIARGTVTRPKRDPVEQAFLGFLAKDMTEHPERSEPPSADLLARARRLTKGMKVGG